MSSSLLSLPRNSYYTIDNLPVTRYRASCIKSRIIPLSPEFIDYIREDGIVLADDDGAEPEDDEWESAPSTFRPPVEEVDSDSDSDEEEEGEEERAGDRGRGGGLGDEERRIQRAGDGEEEVAAQA